MRSLSNIGKIIAIGLITSATVFASMVDADARRAGGFSSFGSRGTRTFDAPAVTRTAPNTAAPIDRTMMQRSQAPSNQAQPGAARRGGLFGGFGGSMLGGLVAGGLLGMFLGHGFGGGGGFLGMLLQLVILFFIIRFAMSFFARRSQPAGNAMQNQAYNDPNPSGSGFRIPSIGGGGNYASSTSRGGDEIGVTQRDLDRFEQLLTDVQTAYGEENYHALRAITTPEAMSYLAEEMGENATHGVRNKVSDVKLLQGDVAESWQENGMDYATLAMRYSSIDAMVDRQTGRLVSGDDQHPSESTEIWTFVRRPGSDWKLSAIQGTEQRAA